MAGKKKTVQTRVEVKEEVGDVVTEKDIEYDILDWINRSARGFAFKINTVGIYDSRAGVYRKPGKFTLPGTSDVLGIWHEKPLAIEVKKGKGVVSPDQKAFIEKFRRMGGIAFVAYSLEDVKRHLEYYALHGCMIVS